MNILVSIWEVFIIIIIIYDMFFSVFCCECRYFIPLVAWHTYTGVFVRTCGPKKILKTHLKQKRASVSVLGYLNSLRVKT